MKKDLPVQYYKESVKGQGELGKQVKHSFGALLINYFIKE